MKTVYQSKFLRQIFHPETRIMEGQWLKNIRITDKDYRLELEKTIETNRKYQPKGILVDTRFFSLTIIPETQHWINQTVFSQYIALEIVKMAFLVPHDFFVYVSIEQTIDEKIAKYGIETQFFDDYDQAKSWVAHYE